MTKDSDSDTDIRFQISHPNLTVSATSPPSAPPTSTATSHPRKKRCKVAKNEPGTTSTNPRDSKKPDTSGAPQIARPCTECGKTFWSWKALFGHMRCHPERQWRGINPPPNHRRPVSLPVKHLTDPWVTFMSEDDHDLAAGLLMLANCNNHNTDGGGGGGSSSSAKQVECCASYHRQQTAQETDLTTLGYRFECGGCRKVFGSHQALGGHRATHKNVKGCFASKKPGEFTEPENQMGAVGDTTVKNQNQTGLVLLGQHKCSICFRVFSSGQALGGHMRCHWEKSEDPNQARPSNDTCRLDLNLPASVEDLSSSSSDSSRFSLDLRLGL